MKKLFFCLFITALTFPAYATIDELTEGWIVTQKIQDDTQFSVQRVPIIGCYGLAQGPQLAQFVSEFQVKSSVGCGDIPNTENINALSCATLVSSTESDDYISFKSITLDISACPYKNNKKFITMVRTAAARNFPQTVKGKVVKGKEVELILLKTDSQ